MADNGIDELFLLTLSGDYDDEAPWDAVRKLRRLGTRDVFDKSAQWCEASDPLKRARGADVLAQLGRTAGHAYNNFPADAYEVVTRLLQRESDPVVISAAIPALGHIGNAAAIPHIVKFRSHESANVRLDVAFALGHFPDEPLSIEVLLELMQDPDEDVRDWATFGLAEGNADSAQVREAFVRCLDDPYQDVREEAMVGLAKRKDERVLPQLVRELKDEGVSPCVIEAATWMLDMNDEPGGWNGLDYANALRQKYPTELST